LLVESLEGLDGHARLLAEDMVTRVREGERDVFC
jgi:hypothetical protein